jgi:hypothetical protein
MSIFKYSASHAHLLNTRLILPVFKHFVSQVHLLIWYCTSIEVKDVIIILYFVSFIADKQPRDYWKEWAFLATDAFEICICRFSNRLLKT